MFQPDRQATLVFADPPRNSAVAFWPVPEELVTDFVELVLPGPDGVPRPVVTPVELRPISDVLDGLACTGIDDERASWPVRALGAATRRALDLVARGAFEPSLTDNDTDCWNPTPVDDHDRSVRDALIGWMPPVAHCASVPGRGDSLLSPAAAVDRLTLAVVDAMPRTAAAPVVSRLPAWADRSTADLAPWRQYLRAVGERSRCIVGLRLAPPATSDGSFSISLQVRDSEDPDRVATAAQLWAGSADGLAPGAEADTLLALRRGAAAWPPLQRMLDEAQPDTIELTDDETVALYGAIAVSLATAGIEVLIPASLSRSIRAVAHVAPTGSTEGGSHFDLASICELTWRASLDGEPLTDEELAQLAESSRPLVKFRGEWVVVDPALARKLERGTTLPAAAGLAAALAGSLVIDDDVVDVELGGSLADLADRLARANEPAELAPPAGLEAELRPYQLRGLAWLAEMADLGLGGLLADDMGLGKTVQLIAVHLFRRPSATAPSLVICPATLLSNWERELHRFAPDVTVHRYHGPDRSLDGVESGDLVLTTYGVVRRDASVLADVAWDLVVADEAQQIKNPASATARAIRQLPAEARIGLTGTPIENRLGDLWALLDWTTPGLLGSLESFRRSIAVPIERDRDADATERFARLVAPFLLRRRKDDPAIVPELPPKTESDLPVALSTEQASLYRAVVDETLANIASAEGMQRRGLVLKLLTSLKQVCNHPAQFLREPGPLPSRSGKLDAFEELVTSITDAGDSTLVFTQYVAMGHLLVKRLDDLGISARFLHGSTPLAERTRLVDEFQAGEFSVFVLSLKAGGTGLNLTRATHVVHYDRWWNPAVENQASDRAWRIGQDRPVQIHRLISEGTIEDRIATVLADKRALADSVTGEGEAWITELSNDELAELVRLGEDR